MAFETDIWFSLIKTMLTTTLTLGMMISLTEFRFSARVVIWTYGGYMLYIGVSSALIIMLCGFLTLLNVYLLTITFPAVVITYLLAKDSVMKAIFNYMTQIDLCLLLTIPVAVMNGGSKVVDIFLRVVVLGSMIAMNYFFIRKPFRRLADLLGGNWFFMALVPTTFCFLISLTARFPVHFTQNPWSLVLLLAIAIVMLVVYFVIFQSLNNGYKLLLYEQAKEVLHTQVGAMKIRMEALQQNAYQAAVYRHDLRHHANLLAGMLNEQKPEEALSYIQKLGNFTVDKQGGNYCENPVINTILSSYLERSKARGMTVACKAVVPEKIDIDEIELCVILSNLLENAIEHCTGTPPWLTVSILQNKSQFCIRIENNFDGLVKRDERGDYCATKSQGRGIGLRSVGAIVKKYHGVMDITHTESSFTVDVGLQL